MTPVDLIIQNLVDTRERSLELWSELKEEHYFWKPIRMQCTALE